MACVPAIYERIFMMIIRKNLEKQGKLQRNIRKEEEFKNKYYGRKRKKHLKKFMKCQVETSKLFISGAAALDNQNRRKIQTVRDLIQCKDMD